MRNIRAFEVGDEVYPAPGNKAWEQHQRGTVVSYLWIVSFGIPIQWLKINVGAKILDNVMATEVESVAVMSKDMPARGYEEEPK
jgi:hypothetical protein